MTNQNASFAAAWAAIDAYNARDPRRDAASGEAQELVYARRMSDWLERIAPDAGEALQLAVRAQHIGRWESPRETFPEGRAGYLSWRRNLAQHHAERAGEIVRTAGYASDFIQRVQSLLRKEHVRTDPEAQTLEDVACLVFLEFYFADFAPQHEPAKVIDIIRKTWRKMSPAAHELALTIPFSPQAAGLVKQALALQ